MSKPQIATILDDGSYGQREMTDEEHDAWLAQIEKEPTNETPSPA